MGDFDSPWKEALDFYFQAFMAFFFRQAHDDIDWARGFEFLDKELQQIVKEAELGKRFVDKLVKVWLKNGEEEWLLIHIEVQTQFEAEFARRVFVYNYRLFDRYNRKVISLAVLADDREEWRPCSFGFEQWGFSHEIRFPIVKLLDYAARPLEDEKNPFGVVVRAHLKAQETRLQPQSRHDWKLTLLKGLYERSWPEDDIRKLFRFIDWIMELPANLESSFWHELKQFEEERHMPFMTTPERIGRREGRAEGLAEGLKEAILVGLEFKYPAQAQEMMTVVHRISDVESLRQVLQAVKSAPSLEEVRSALNRVAPAPA